MSLASLVSEDIESLLHVDAAPMCFGFSYGGLKYDADYSSQGAAGLLVLRAHIGPLPYSTESRAARNGLLTILARANEDLNGASFGLIGNEFYLLCRRQVAGSLTSLGILGTAVQHLLPLLPYLDLIFYYLTPPMQLAPGEPALRSEWRPKIRTTGFNKVI